MRAVVPVCGFHICTVSSSAPEAMSLPSGDHAIERTGAVCPEYGSTSVIVGAGGGVGVFDFGVGVEEACGCRECDSDAMKAIAPPPTTTTPAPINPATTARRETLLCLPVAAGADETGAETGSGVGKGAGWTGGGVGEMGEGRKGGGEKGAAGGWAASKILGVGGTTGAGTGCCPAHPRSGVLMNVEASEAGTPGGYAAAVGSV